MSLYDEILEQPEVLSNLVRSKDKILDIAQILRSKDIKYIFLTARGSSDNAGLYAKYLFGSVNKLPVALAAPSLFTIYKAPPRLEGALVMGISQSGMSTDLLEVIKQSREMAARPSLLRMLPIRHFPKKLSSSSTSKLAKKGLSLPRRPTQHNYSQSRCSHRQWLTNMQDLMP
jgi:hypothetical protein